MSVRLVLSRSSSLVIACEIVRSFHIEIFIVEFMNRDTALLLPPSLCNLYALGFKITGHSFGLLRHQPRRPTGTAKCTILELKEGKWVNINNLNMVQQFWESGKRPVRQRCGGEEVRRRAWWLSSGLGMKVADRYFSNFFLNILFIFYYFRYCQFNSGSFGIAIVRISGCSVRKTVVK